jgi:hypothetical protein
MRNQDSGFFEFVAEVLPEIFFAWPRLGAVIFVLALAILCYGHYQLGW